ncbi:HNH endonuclease [Tenacibaculum mesophilum]|uniref:HNH endonuclease n=1 Tax=Tenacibaculum mesophilum TaxID=104268 RepID=A0AAE9MQZ1_9FLAO|nr:HNH endonuclease [Tenacibaculum mesophilum]UTD16569.1 HNH endonuclease [Tenacibaculum mesophilum]
MSKKIRKSIPQKNKVRAELQKEISSICPFCDNEDVGHFEIHHIDENPSNNEAQNLLLLCPICHSKITKGDITIEEVKNTKEKIKSKADKIRFISVTVDSDNCSWQPIENIPQAFEAVKMKSLFPIFNFSFINQTKQTVLLTNIVIKTKRLPIGLAGPDIPLPNILRPLINYKIKLPGDGEKTNTILSEEIEIPQGRAFKFQVELFDESMEKFKPPFNKYVLFFEFGFNNDFYIEVPKILLNSKEDYDKLPYYGLA